VALNYINRILLLCLAIFRKISNVKNAFGKSSDLNLRTLRSTKEAAIFFISGITNSELINEHIIDRLNEDSFQDIEELKNIISVNNINESGNQSEIINELVKVIL
jgi:hypothetical protein